MIAEQDITTFAEKLRRSLAGADEFPEHWAWPQRHVAWGPHEPPHFGTELQQAYEEATGTLVGCD